MRKKGYVEGGITYYLQTLAIYVMLFLDHKRRQCVVVIFFMIELRTSTNAQYRVKVGRSKAGLGLFALEPIPKGRKIIEYVGRVLMDEPEDAANNLYIFNIDEKTDIDGSPRWNSARYINHSCRPNAESEITDDGHVWIQARRDIMLGEEITYDYGKEYWNEYIKPKGCRCEKCKGNPQRGMHFARPFEVVS